MSNRLEDANPYTAEQVEALVLHAEDALRDAIPRHRPRTPRRRRIHWPLTGAAATAAAAAVLAIVFMGGSAADRAWSAEALRVADAVPRILLAGWDVTRADEFSVGVGEMEFARGGRHLELRWERDALSRLVAERSAGARRLDDVSVLGTKARLFTSRTVSNDHTALWQSGGYVLELRPEEGAPLDMEEFARAVGSLREVGVETWLSAMPASVVLPAETQRTIDEMLADIPLPDGFDRDSLRAGAARERYQLGARVSGAVTCAWIEQWLAGDAADRSEAAAALASSREWNILLEMRSDGDYPAVVWEYADVVNGDGTVMGGRPLSVEESYRSALGC